MKTRGGSCGDLHLNNRVDIFHRCATRVLFAATSSMTMSAEPLLCAISTSSHFTQSPVLSTCPAPAHVTFPANALGFAVRGRPLRYQGVRCN